MERFHWSLEREYFRDQRPATISDAIDGLVDWLNYYNFDRPHSQLSYRPPGEVFEAGRVKRADLETIGKDPGPQEGVVEAVRLVLGGGLVDLWEGQWLRVSPLLAGQYVRVQFTVPGPGFGQVVYVRKGDEELVMATFRHRLDQKGGFGKMDLVSDVELNDFGTDVVPPNEGIDMEQLANQRSRILKRRSPLERIVSGETQGEADEPGRLDVGLDG